MLSRISINDIPSLYMSLPIAACLIDRDMRFLAANGKYADLMQKPLSAIIGGSMHDINPSQHIDNVRRDFNTFDQGGCVEDHEIIVRSESLLVSVNPFFREGDSVASAISVTLQNISLRKKMETDLVAAHQELVRAKRQIEKLAHTDTLTNLPNRRGFDAAITREIRLSRRRSSPLALALIDVDVFKLYNDIYGHVAGDICLASVAGVIAKGIRRPGDFSARYGGEEFVVILPQTEIAGALRVAENLRRSIHALNLPHRGHTAGVVTASFGVAATLQVPRDISADEATRLLLERADEALYKAKESGRNCIVNGGIAF